jgi:hypothetical protein
VRAESEQENAMTIEVYAFFVIAASLVLIGFASGPLVARHADARGRRRIAR